MLFVMVAVDKTMILLFARTFTLQYKILFYLNQIYFLLHEHNDKSFFESPCILLKVRKI